MYPEPGFHVILALANLLPSNYVLYLHSYSPFFDGKEFFASHKSNIPLVSQASTLSLASYVCMYATDFIISILRNGQTAICLFVCTYVCSLKSVC